MKGGIDSLVRQAQIMQKKMAKAQEELAERTVEATSGGGMVKIIATGTQELKSVHIDPIAITTQDVDMLEDLILAAANEALRRSREIADETMGILTDGLKMPGLF